MGWGAGANHVYVSFSIILQSYYMAYMARKRSEKKMISGWALSGLRGIRVSARKRPSNSFLSLKIMAALGGGGLRVGCTVKMCNFFTKRKKSLQSESNF